MEIRQCILIISIAILVTTIFINPTVAAAYSRRLKFQDNRLMKKVKILTHFEQEDPKFPFYIPSSISAQEYALSSPLFLPPFDSLAPLPLPPLPPPQPLSPPPPFRPINVPLQSPPPPPGSVTAIPPLYYIPSPPYLEGPPSASPRHAPSPPKHRNPSSPAFLPPFVYPPPLTVAPPPPRRKKPVQTGTVWCVAKPTVPDPIIQEAMDYACSTGADCKLIQPNGPCYKPDTLLAHASFAFNSYWKSTKEGGGTCDFGGTAMLVTVDPSFDGCSFIFN